MRKSIILILILVFFCAANLYLLFANLNFKASIKNLGEEKEAEFKDLLKSERQKIKNDLEELHRVDTVSYKAMAKRMEIEKKKAKNIEDELNEAQKELEEYEKDSLKGKKKRRLKPIP